MTPPPQGQPDAGSADPTPAGVVAAKDGEQAPVVRGGLDPRRVNRLGQALAATIGKLSGGEATPEMPTVDGQIDQLPPQIYSPLVAIAGFIDQAGKEVEGISQYAYNPQEVASSNDGIDTGYAAIQGLGQDKDVVRALTGGKPAGKPKAPPAKAPPAAEPDGDDYSQLAGK